MQFVPSSPAPSDYDRTDPPPPITVNDLRVLAWHYDLDDANTLQKPVQPALSTQGHRPHRKRRKMSTSPPKRSSSPTKRQRRDSPDSNSTPAHVSPTPSPTKNDDLDPVARSSYAHLVNLTSAIAVPPVGTPRATASETETVATRSSQLSITARTRLVPTISSASAPKSRTRSPPRNMLNGIRDVVDCRPPESDKAMIPACVHELRRRLALNFGARVIPEGLKEQLQEHSLLAFEDIPEYAFDEGSEMTEKELGELWRTVCGILRAAEECKEYSKDENTWCMSVVRETLAAGISTPGDDPTIPHSQRAKAPERSILELNSVQSQSIDPLCLPTLSRTNQAISRKADFMLAFNASHPDVYEFYRRVSFGGLNIPLSPMTDDYTMRCAPFAGVEVKTAAGNTGEGLTQLAIWMAAGLNNLQMLREMGGERVMGGEEGRFGLLPMVGWVVHEHYWSFYVGYRNVDEGDGKKVTVLGPFGTLNAGTDTYYEVFKLINLVRRLHAYAREIYWPWLRVNVLEPLLL